MVAHNHTHHTYTRLICALPRARAHTNQYVAQTTTPRTHTRTHSSYIPHHHYHHDHPRRLAHTHSRFRRPRAARHAGNRRPAAAGRPLLGDHPRSSGGPCALPHARVGGGLLVHLPAVSPVEPPQRARSLDPVGGHQRRRREQEGGEEGGATGCHGWRRGWDTLRPRFSLRVVAAACRRPALQWGKC